MSMDIAPTRPRRILIVDDDPVIRMVVREALTTPDIFVVEACDAEEGLEILLLQHIQVDAIIIDIMLPRMDGLQFLDTIRDRGHAQPVLVFSAVGSHHEDRALALGATRYISKPFDLAELAHIMDDLLRDTDDLAESA